MSPALRQGLLIAAGGGLLSCTVILLARRQLISLVCARLDGHLLHRCGRGVVDSPREPVASVFGMSPTGLLLAGATVVRLTITLQLSISVSGLQRQLHDVAEAHALLAQRVRELE